MFVATGPKPRSKRTKHERRVEVEECTYEDGSPIGRMSEERQRKRPRRATLATTAASKPSRRPRRPRGVPGTTHRFDSRFATNDGTRKIDNARERRRRWHAAINRRWRGGRRAGGVDGECGRGRSTGRTEGRVGPIPWIRKIGRPPRMYPGLRKGLRLKIEQAGTPRGPNNTIHMKGGGVRLTEMDLGKPCGGWILVVGLSLRLNRETWPWTG